MIYLQKVLCASSNRSSWPFRAQSVHKNPVLNSLGQNITIQLFHFFPILAFFPCAVHTPPILSIGVQLIFPAHYPILQLSVPERNEVGLTPLNNLLGIKAEPSLWV